MEKQICKPHTHCRACNSNNLVNYLSLGDIPLANNLENTQEEAINAERFPLEIMLCIDCGLSQLSVVIDPEKLFSYYTYRSGISKGYIDHCREMAKTLKEKYNLNQNSFAVDLACFPKGSFVNTNKGYIDISDVKRGDAVLSHDGLYHKVIKLYSKVYSGELIKFKLKTLNVNFNCTPEHPILTERGWIEAKNIIISDKIKIGNSIFEQNDNSLKLEELSDLYHPFKTKREKGRIYPASNGIKSSIPEKIDIDASLARIIGYYIGEGDGAAKSSIRFSFHHSKEDDKIKEIEEYFKNTFSLNSEIYTHPHKGSKNIRIHSRILSSIFRGMCGDGAYNKKIPNFIQDSKILPHFLKALWFTDGHLSLKKRSRAKDALKDRKIYVYSTVSKILIVQLRNILESMGIKCSVQCIKNNRGFSKKDGYLFRLTIEKKESVILLESIFNEKVPELRNTQKYCDILSIIKLESPEIEVFNIEVEEANSYVCDGIIVHNCNDGSLLKEFSEEIGCKILGIDPAVNLTKICRDRGIPAWDAFWEYTIAKSLKDQVEVLTATNVFAHCNDIRDFLQGAKIALKPNGILVIECPYVVDHIEKLEYTQTYFEHLSYMSISPINTLCKELDLKIIDIEKQEIHGGTIRITISHKDSIYTDSEDKVGKWLDFEYDNKFLSLNTYKEWAEKVKRSISNLTMDIGVLKLQGKKIAGFGASAKGNTLLNSALLDYDLIDYIIDQTPEKIGKFSPGTGIPIIDIDILSKNPPDYLIILSWNFKDEIIKKVRDIGYKGKFIVPIPEFQIIN